MSNKLADLSREAELFLYREAKLLDEGAFDEWLDLFAEELPRFDAPAAKFV